jgi:hypothetical protein
MHLSICCSRGDGSMGTGWCCGRAQVCCLAVAAVHTPKGSCCLCLLLGHALQRLNEAEANLLRERTAHDATRQQLRAVQAQLSQLRANAGVASPDAGPAAPAGSGPGGGGRAAANGRGKRGAAAMEPAADQPETDGDQVTPAAAGGRSTKKQRVQSGGAAAAAAAEDAEMLDSPISPFDGEWHESRCCVLDNALRHCIPGLQSTGCCHHHTCVHALHTTLHRVASQAADFGGASPARLQVCPLWAVPWPSPSTRTSIPAA